MKVYCLSCNRTIGELRIRDKNYVEYVQENGILAARFRFDGHWGFECTCGNDSRLAKAEQGIITGSIPTRDELKLITQNLIKNPTITVKTEQGLECDGFIISEVENGRS